MTASPDDIAAIINAAPEVEFSSGHAGRAGDVAAGALELPDDTRFAEPADSHDSGSMPPVPPTPTGGASAGGLPPVNWDLVKLCAQEPETDIGNARRFLHRHGETTLSIEGLGWAIHDGRRWGMDYHDSLVRPLAHETVELIRHESKLVKASQEEFELVAAAREAFPRWRELKKKGRARTPEDETELLTLGGVVKAGQDAQAEVDDRRARRVRYGKTSASTGKMDNMLSEARVYRSGPVSVLDADAYALNVANGTLRLFQRVPDGPARDGAGIWDVCLDPHNKTDLISKLAEVDFRAEDECPLFLNFLDTILPDDDVRAFMQRYLGYCMTALTREQVFVFLYGSGRNGKSTLVDLICRLLGDYTTTVPFETLAGDDRRKGSEATPDLVRVPGARIVRASEPESGMKFRESMVKSLTSGEPILIRRMREEFIEIYPTFKLIISGNHRPDIRGGDDGIWRRVLLVPFEVQIPKDQVDRALPDKLWVERAGILNWLIAGALSYLQEGLRVPEAVRAATDEYREQSDPYGAFLKAACDVTGDDTDVETPGDLYAAFKIFCERQGFFAVGVSTFNKALPEKAATHGFRKAKSMGLSVYRGIRVNPDFKPAPPSYTPERGYDD